jgi:hypothetical protein
MKTTGRCHCGEIEYAAEIDERRIAVCHCTDCQIMGGGAFRFVAGITPDKIQVTKGEPRQYDKIAQSGNTRRMHFCGTCGTQLYSGSTDPSDTSSLVSLRLTTCADRARLRPIAELWCASRLDWLPALDVKLSFEQQS